MLFERDPRVGFSQGRSKKSTNPSSSQGAFYHKRSVNSQQRNIEASVIRLTNAAVSQIQLGPTQEMTQFSFSPCNTQQRGFLPKMFKKSNFARTQKAIKMIREGPLKGRGKGIEDQGGHFMKLNDYAALHGMLAPGEANQQPLQSQQQLVTP